MAETTASLTAQIERLRQEADALRTELDETNQGVLALYAELDTQADQLRQASDLKSRFLSYMSHEFRTPLGSILSITSLLADELDGLPKLYTDDKKLAQILRNFISNALKFTQHGEVRVSARMENAHEIRFAVQDTGLGIPAELHNNLFEDFSQIDSPLQKRLRGTGLGLSLCKRFGELLGGRVGVESTLGVGSLFFVIIPFSIASENVDET